jgi:hypothetical protein
VVMRDWIKRQSEGAVLEPEPATTA